MKLSVCVAVLSFACGSVAQWWVRTLSPAFLQLSRSPWMLVYMTPLHDIYPLPFPILTNTCRTVSQAWEEPLDYANSTVKTQVHNPAVL